MKRLNRKSSQTRSRSKDSRSEARQYALKLISIRGRSEQELRQRLAKRGYSKELIDETVEEIRRYGYIADETLAEDLIRYAQKIKYLGSRGIKAFLTKRGIPDGIIEQAGLEEIDEERIAEELVRKRLNRFKGLTEEQLKGRLYRLLQRKGFSYDTIKGILNRLSDFDEI